MKLSLCMIVKNEEDVLARCLESVKTAVDEIVIVDTGSTDKTREIAPRYTDLVFDEPWQDDFSAARNAAFGKASGDYLLWLDADDVVLPCHLERLLKLKERLVNENADVAMCRYESGVIFWRERILRNCPSARWVGHVHECISPFGKLIRDDFTVTHLSSDKERGTRNLHIYQKWRAKENFGSRDLFYYGRELYYNKLYTESIAVLEEMLRGDGWYVNKIEACKILAGCYSAKGDGKATLGALFQSFCYGLPRGGICHAIARELQNENKLREAIYWYEAALACPDFSCEGDFDSPEERTLFPLLGLVCCHARLGNTQAALDCHARARALAPQHPSVVHNQTYFEEKGLLPKQENLQEPSSESKK